MYGGLSERAVALADGLARDFPEVAARIPEHRRVIDFRNVLAHGYDVVDPRLVFGLARTRLPALLAALRTVS